MTMGDLIQVDDHKWAVWTGGKPRRIGRALLTLPPSMTRPHSIADSPSILPLSKPGVLGCHIDSPKEETSTNS